MAEINLDIRSVEKLQGMKFFIPRFQRGYRWERQQVRDLLDDLKEFIEEGENGFYSLQPLVVQRHEDTRDLLEKVHDSNDIKEIRKLVSTEEWRVIDGQQRLTTVSIILQFLGITSYYTIEYEVLKKSTQWINNITQIPKAESDSNINLYHMKESYDEINEWFQKYNADESFKDRFKQVLLTKTKFIWYENDDEDPIKIFTRLNIGQIKLTNSELIKALFLNRSNFKDFNNKIRIDERAEDWDRIELTLQNDEFFLFLNSLDYYNHYDKPTRIDFLFDFICKNDFFTYDKDYVGNDQYKTFRCFYYCYKNNKEEFEKLWDNVVKKVFNIFFEWYSEINLYHYIGYILCLGKASIIELYKNWLSHDKFSFLKDYLFIKIKEECLSNCQDINKDYDINKKKNEAEPILLLYNIQTIVNKNRIMKENEKYLLGVFYKFPFHLYKKENWNIEHIDSNTENDLDDVNSQKAWVLSTYTCLDDDEREKIKDGVTRFFSQVSSQGSTKTELEEVDFDKIKDKMEKLIYKYSCHKVKNDKWKNRIYNYTLLDETTNKSYKNAIFPAKRICIIDKEKVRVKRVTWNSKEKKINVGEVEAKSAFVPICTSNVFQRAYSANISDITIWSREDAIAYGTDIVSTLTNVKIGNSSETFDFIDNKKVNIDE